VVNIRLTLRGLTFSLLLIGSHCHAHLLNMTKVIVTINANQQLDIDMQVDMSRAAGGPTQYYRLSQLADPLHHDALKEIFGKLVQSIALQYGGKPLELQLVQAELPKLPLEQFLNPVSWPMTQLRLRGTLPTLSASAPHQLQGVFKPGFRFEEPIALTFMLAAEQRSMTRWLIAGQTSPLFDMQSTRVTAAASDNNPLWRYLVFGFTHILPNGIDHVLFVLGLYLGARSFKSLLVLVTCFTLAHSITLGMASLNIIHLPGNIVEPLIAASIVWVGVENFFIKQTAAYRPALVFGFGLLHGLGFASALSELDLPQTNFLLALLSFNVGIELGQLSVIALAVLATLWLRQRSWYRRRITLPASFIIAVIAGFWTVQRIWA
jgi:HupE / UreJ protein